MAQGSASELSRVWQKRVRLADREFKKTMRGIGETAVKFTKEQMTKDIYAIPEDRSKNGKKKWQRTHRLYKGERYEMTDPYSVRIVNDVPYAQPRHDAGKPGHRKINPVRESHWRDEMQKVMQPFLKDALELTIRDIERQF